VSGAELSGGNVQLRVNGAEPWLSRSDGSFVRPQSAARVCAVFYSTNTHVFITTHGRRWYIASDAGGASRRAVHSPLECSPYPYRPIRCRTSACFRLFLHSTISGNNQALCATSDAAAAAFAPRSTSCTSTPARKNRCCSLLRVAAVFVFLASCRFAFSVSYFLVPCDRLSCRLLPAFERTKTGL